MTRPRQVTIAGKTYASVNAAAQALEVSRTTLVDRLAGADTLAEVPKRKPRLGQPVPVRIRGRDYASIKAAAIDLGVSVQTVGRHLDAGTPDRIGRHPYSGRNQPNRYETKGPLEGSGSLG